MKEKQEAFPLCQWANKTWLASTTTTLDEYCNRRTNDDLGIEGGGDEELMSSLGGADDYITGGASKELQNLYEDNKSASVDQGCTGQSPRASLPSWDQILAQVVDTLHQDPKRLNLGRLGRDWGLVQDVNLRRSWGNVLTRKVCQGSSVNRKWAGALMCLIGTLAVGTNQTRQSWGPIPDVCGNFLDEVIGSSHPHKEEAHRNSQESTLTADDRTRDRRIKKEVTAFLSLILTIYDLIKRCCVGCGPYSIERWAAGIGPRTIKQETVYCKLDNTELKCYRSPQETEQGPGYLRYSGASTPSLRDISLSPSDQTGTYTRQHRTPVLDGGEQGHLTQESASGDPSKERRSIETDVSSDENRGQDAPDGTQQDQEHSTRRLESLSSDPNDNGPPEKEDESSAPTGGKPTKDKDGTGEEQVPTAEDLRGATLPTQGESEQEPPSQTTSSGQLTMGSVGGIITSMILSALGIYGFWRIRFRNSRDIKAEESRRYVKIGYG
ncbi:hypothetical protein C922_00282 [Plasmodium inui San Antonio 1]|uniref:Uncharacterized protein n=1 Tax=Plasmodium inui San Antonio 1 TaxID=1237626 RepID=W7AKS5_9APIC|nr:hypothetical protein C922_00282 [Plasmodium inui San Antonio 1]EUD69419.1 hypothetical protein C922_00282 [Plasmodium inui San Antonio 1]